ncbi:MAG TPA: peptide chain release factor N(5)-glutamine methyltransferase [Methylophilaceae bacterium]|jgi:release factor glutamine methyltransferase
MRLQALIAGAQKTLSSVSDSSPNEAKLEAQLLLQHLLKVNRAWLITHENDALEPNILAEFEAALKRRMAGEPIAYILGKREFYGLELNVTPDTLIPRPDTETLVEAALAKIPANQTCSILDLGTGTGAIAIALAAQRPRAEVTAVDQSSEALAVAKNNAQRLGIANVRFLQSDWFLSLGDMTFDIIVSNPPYIAEDDPHLRQGDLRFEPISALAAGPDGLRCIRHIINSASAHLHPGGTLMFEHGYDQAEKVASLMIQAGFAEVISLPDLAGILRVTSATWRNKAMSE